MKSYFFILSLLFAAVSFPASANYALNGQCFVTATEALDSFTSSFPRLEVLSNSGGSGGTVLVWLSVSTASIDGQNLTTVIRKDSTNQASITLPVQSCTVPTSAAFDLTQALAAFAFFFSAVLIVFLVSHSSGSIISFIKGRPSS